MQKVLCCKIVWLLSGLFLLAAARAQEKNPPLTHSPLLSSVKKTSLPRQLQPQQPQAEYPAGGEKVETLERFGLNLFRGQALPQELGLGGTLPADYRLGPGDRLAIYLGGKSQEHFEVAVSVDGQIYIPTVGIISVNGLTLDAFKQLMDEKLGKYYSNYDIEVMLLAPKKVWVSVVGEVKAPGNYALSALNSVLDAIVAAKGLTEKGSLRDVQLYRADTLYAHVDLYDFLLQPALRNVIFLQSGDQIYVPVIRSQIRVTGEVRREAIYELDPNHPETLSDAIALAGGFTDLALLSKIEVSRTMPDGQRQVRYINFTHLDSSNADQNIILKNNDQIHVYSIRDQIPRQVVSIHGEVKEPGQYLFEENMRVSDLILRAGSLTKSAYLLQAEVARVDPKKPPVSIKIDLRGVLDGSAPEQDLLLEPDDHVFIRRVPGWQVGPLVQVSGEVKFPGYYPIVPDSTTLRDVILQAGGFTSSALVSEAKLIRHREPVLQDREFERLKKMTREEMSDQEYEYFVMRQNTENVREVVVDFVKLMRDGDERENVTLQDGDLISIPKKPDVVYVSGRVSKPGGILYRPGADVNYYITKAGGYSWDADRHRTRVIKVTGEIINDEDVKSFQPGDRIWVPRKPERNYWQILRDTILVAGQMATIYLVIRNASKK